MTSRAAELKEATSSTGTLREYILAHPDLHPKELRDALIHAALNRSYGSVRMLLNDPRTDFASTDLYWRWDVLSAVCISDDPENIRLLLSDPRTQNLTQDNFNRALRECIREQKLEGIRLLAADPRCDPSADGSQALVDILRLYGGKKQAEAMRILLADPRADPLAIFRYNKYIHYDTIRLIFADSRVTGGAAFSVVSPAEWADCPEPAPALWDGPVANPEPRLLSVRSARLPALVRQWRAEGRQIPPRLVAEGLAPLEAELALVRGAAAALVEAVESTASLLFLMLAGVVGEHAALQLRLARAEAGAEEI